MMQIKEIMTREPVVIGPDMVLREAAETMRDLDSGVCRSARTTAWSGC